MNVKVKFSACGVDKMLKIGVEVGLSNRLHIEVHMIDLEVTKKKKVNDQVLNSPKQ